VTTAPVPADSGADDRARIGAEYAAQLRRRGVRLSGDESDEQLADLIESVERFETAVERGGGDLMMDAPVSGSGAPIAPDDVAFLLPIRGAKDSVATYIDRVVDATVRAEAQGR
jgi:hypothetical protein